MNTYKRILASAVIMLALDFIYLSYNRAIYETQTVQIQRVMMNVQVLPAIICYLLLIIGLNVFILNRHRPVMEAFLLGLIVYGVYNMTSLAIYKKYTWTVAAMDTLWGGVLFAIVTAIIYNL
jgi:uncharacterized membrane protein